MYQLKTIPEDFIVKERSNVTIQAGSYLYFTLVKRGRTTLDVIQELARVLNLKEKVVGFAGIKDKDALTTQVISLRGVSKERVMGITLPNVQLTFLGTGQKPITLGDLYGNSFEIVVRNLSKEKIKLVNFIVNYFDEQRFSSANVAIGKKIIKKDFLAAAKLINHKACQDYLTEHSTDSVGALRQLPERLLRLYVNAYQSFLWNEVVALYLSKKNGMQKISYSLGTFILAEREDLQVPLIGFNLEQYQDEVIWPYICAVMEKEVITAKDFVIKQIPALTLEGELREAFVKVDLLKIGKMTSDELNAKKKKVSVTFTLGKGSYATMVIRHIIK